MTITYPAASNSLDVDGVYPPQVDSQLLIDTLERTELARGRRVLDLCTGSGVIAIAAADMPGLCQVDYTDMTGGDFAVATFNAGAAGQVTAQVSAQREQGGRGRDVSHRLGE